MRSKHYIPDGFEPGPEEKVGDESYKNWVEKRPRPSTDILAVGPDERFLIGTRTGHPHPHEWYVGGRWQFCRSAAESAAFHMREEAGLDIEPTRMDLIPLIPSSVWRMPDGTLRHDTAVVHLLRLTQGEVDSLRLNPRHFSRTEWLTGYEILEGDFHPTLKDVVQAAMKLMDY